jgi:hypothetical protein
MMNVPRECFLDLAASQPLVVSGRLTNTTGGFTMSHDHTPSLNGVAKKRTPTLTQREEAAQEALTVRYDALNQKFTEVELQLRELKPIYSVWVDYAHWSAPNGPDFWELLGLTKHQGKWRLCHAEDDEMNANVEGEAPLNIKPLVECPIEIRVRAAAEVRKLHEAIVKSKESFIPLVDQAIQELTKICQEI